jgi:hypothetical protein
MRIEKIMCDICGKEIYNESRFLSGSSAWKIKLSHPKGYEQHSATLKLDQPDIDAHIACIITDLNKELCAPVPTQSIFPNTLGIGADK